MNVRKVVWRGAPWGELVGMNDGVFYLEGVEVDRFPARTITSVAGEIVLYEPTTPVKADTLEITFADVDMAGHSLVISGAWWEGTVRETIIQSDAHVGYSIELRPGLAPTMLIGGVLATGLAIVIVQKRKRR